MSSTDEPDEPLIPDIREAATTSLGSAAGATEEASKAANKGIASCMLHSLAWPTAQT
jgi:hypothetical protein